MTVSLDGKNALKVENRNGKYIITFGYFNQSCEFKPSWCRWGFEPKEGEKPQTYSINIGDKDTALAVLREIADEINGGTPF